MKTKEANKLIFEFLGFKPIVKSYHGINIYEDDKNNMFDISNSKYFNSWDWLIKVIDKIESLGFEFNMTGKNNYVAISDEKNVFIGSTKSKKENIQNAILQFLEWYNKNN